MKVIGVTIYPWDADPTTRTYLFDNDIEADKFRQAATDHLGAENNPIADVFEQVILTADEAIADLIGGDA